MNTLLHLGAIGMPGPMEWMIIAFLALIIFGPKKLPELARAIGESVNSFKDGIATKPKPGDAADPSLGGPARDAGRIEEPRAARATSEVANEQPAEPRPTAQG